MFRPILLSVALLFTVPSFAAVPATMEVAGFIDNTPQGPVNRPTAIKSLDQFKKIFMGPSPKAYEKNRAYLQVKQYFLNGGEWLYFNRIVGKDYLGDESSETGIYAFAQNSIVKTLVIPGLNTLPEPAVSFARREIFEFVQQKKMMLIMDAPATLSFKKILAWRDINLEEVEESYKKYIVVYFNRILVDGIYIGASGSMAGIFAKTSVWRAPSNIMVLGASKVEFDIDNDQQRKLNTPANGLSINVIRNFPNLGILAWGARTLDGNSQEWRYISSTRMQIQIEESIISTLSAYRSEANDVNTWITVQSVITNYLVSLWKQGALPGAIPSEAFTVEVGLGTTMTPEDVLNKIMRVQVMVALMAPNEFIIMTFEQEVGIH
jgi:phage tail sheath protein FI